METDVMAQGVSVDREEKRPGDRALVHSSRNPHFI